MSTSDRSSKTTTADKHSAIQWLQPSIPNYQAKYGQILQISLKILR